MMKTTKRTAPSLQRELEQLEKTDPAVSAAAKKYDATVRSILAKPRPRMTTSEEAIPVTTQPTKPCHDCPFARTAINGWLGGNTAAEWSAMVQGEVKIPCHAFKGPQCAGAAIMRGNMCKRPRDRSLLVLPPDRERVFSHTREFEEHHAKTMRRPAARSRSASKDVKTEVLELLDDLIAPERMPREEAFEVVTDLIDDLEARASAMRAEMRAIEEVRARAARAEMLQTSKRQRSR